MCTFIYNNIVYDVFLDQIRPVDEKTTPKNRLIKWSKKVPMGHGDDGEVFIYWSGTWFLWFSQIDSIK